MNKYNKRSRQIINYAELRTQEAEDEESRHGLTLTGNTLLLDTGINSNGRLRTRKETPESRIETQFAKQSLDIRVEALNLRTKKISISAISYDEYLIARAQLKKKGWDVRLDNKRIPKATSFSQA